MRTFSKRDREWRRKQGERCRMCGREFGVVEVPDAALRLAEDIQTLDDMLTLLGRVEASSVVRADGQGNYDAARQNAVEALRKCAFVIGELKRAGWDNLRRLYLTPGGKARSGQAK